MKKYVVIVAGGKGTRMRTDLPKQFLSIHNRPVLMRTIDRFCEYDATCEPVVVLPLDQMNYWQELCAAHHFERKHHLVAGGNTRFHSVHNALNSLPDDENALVAIHDGVRPFVSVEVITRCFDAASQHLAALPVTDMIESVRQITGEGMSRSVPRNAYVLVQTPQTFNLHLLKQAYQQPYEDRFTDDASVVEALGINPVMVQGNRENIKITTPLDIQIASLFC